MLKKKEAKHHPLARSLILDRSPIAENHITQPQRRHHDDDHRYHDYGNKHDNHVSKKGHTLTWRGGGGWENCNLMNRNFQQESTTEGHSRY